MLEKISGFLATLVIAAGSLAGAPQQSMQFHLPGGAGSLLLLPGCVYLLEDDKESKEVRISQRIQVGAEPSEDKKVDLEQGDVVMMIDGRLVHSKADFSKHYDEVKVGDQVSLGIRRESEVLVVSFAKPQPGDLPQIQTMRRKADGSTSEVKADGAGNATVITKEKPKPPFSHR